ncbi:MAG: hypothetical protein E7559_00790 [Ruminococcaceae bacterium]|nr:hypothetical protein [Oscillospiraceae bacterium]
MNIIAFCGGGFNVLWGDAATAADISGFSSAVITLGFPYRKVFVVQYAKNIQIANVFSVFLLTWSIERA